MAIEITRPGKYSLIVDSPVLNAAGTLGFGEHYKNLINYDKLGALVTNPVSLEPRLPANGTRVIELDSGVLMHTGLPNPGLNAVIRDYRNTWRRLAIPIVVHLLANSPESVAKAASRLEDEDNVAAIELGMPDDIPLDDAIDFVEAVKESTQKPLLVRLPMFDAYALAEGIVDAGADALVVVGAPRGTARDPHTGKLVSGRIYGPLVKAFSLRMVGVLARQIKDVPILGAGGIHSAQDGRDFIEAGATAIQVDAVTWVQPQMLERISRDLGGWITTFRSGSFPDEWHPNMGDTEWNARNQAPPAEDKS